jgi:DNA-binding PadR family transcriptional regulator
MSPAADLWLSGGFEELILLAVLRLGDQAYGVRIMETVSATLGRRVGPGAVYVCLGRLRAQGFVTSWEGSPTPVRGGRARRFYRLTDQGVQALTITEQARQRLRSSESVCSS